MPITKTISRIVHTTGIVEVQFILTLYPEESPDCACASLMILSDGYVAPVTSACQWISSALLEYSDCNPAESWAFAVYYHGPSAGETPPGDPRPNPTLADTLTEHPFMCVCESAASRPQRDSSVLYCKILQPRLIRNKTSWSRVLYNMSRQMHKYIDELK